MSQHAFNCRLYENSARLPLIPWILLRPTSMFRFALVVRQQSFHSNQICIHPCGRTDRLENRVPLPIGSWKILQDNMPSAITLSYHPRYTVVLEDKTTWSPENQIDFRLSMSIIVYLYCAGLLSAAEKCRLAKKASRRNQARQRESLVSSWKCVSLARKSAAWKMMKYADTRSLSNQQQRPVGLTTHSKFWSNLPESHSAQA